jgi:flavin-dependent dehydrogenase
MLTGQGENTDILVVGGGPGGLACATLLAQGGARVVLAERKPGIGPKVCAGGITWHGLLKHVPAQLIERQFPEQHIVTRRQRAVVKEENPIIATINRERVGRWMADQAETAGVTILTGTRVAQLADNRAVLERTDGRRLHFRFTHLVGADGSNSLVRRSLGLPTTAQGIGLNSMLPGRHLRMEWHLNPELFGSGYGWIFPHSETCSIGAYGESRIFTARTLKQRLIFWAEQQGYRLDPDTIRAGLVNFDYRGVRFDRTWLVGDAAGLASGLTGEGIYPALVSGQAVARMILDPDYPGNELRDLAKKHRQHSRIVLLAGRHQRLRGVLMEMMVTLLRMKIIDFHHLEMAK